MRPESRTRFPLTTVLTAAALLTAGSSMTFPRPHDATDVRDVLFTAENNAAMDRMMRSMTIAPSGDVDRDFVATMVPHHQGAIDMAQAELRYGRNEQLRRLAQEIIVTQGQEIVVMRMAIGQPPAPSATAPARPRDEGPQ